MAFIGDKMCAQSVFTFENRQYLEGKHRQPYCLGGNTTASNVRILCGRHNRLLYGELQEQSLV